jgi:hypothetical protein
VSISETPATAEELLRLLSAEFPGVPVQSEWAALSGEVARYSPRIDFVVGPFATGSARLAGDYGDMLVGHRPLIERLYASYRANVSRLDETDSVASLVSACARNPNARCFVAIEIERTGSRKHMMGGCVNAAALGRIGIVVACSEERLRALLKIRRYLLFLATVGKNSFDPSNLFVVSEEQLLQGLQGGRT